MFPCSSILIFTPWLMCFFASSVFVSLIGFSKPHNPILCFTKSRKRNNLLFPLQLSFYTFFFLFFFLFYILYYRDFFIRFVNCLTALRILGILFRRWHLKIVIRFVYLKPSNPSLDPLIVRTGALAYAFATLRFLSKTITLAQISSSIWFHLSSTSWI